MKLITEPDAGVAPIVTAIKQAKKTIDVLIFRLDVVAHQEGLDRGHFDAPHHEHHHDIGATGRSTG